MNSKLKTIRTALDSVSASISNTFIFTIDTLSLILFALVILGIVEHLPSYTNTIIQVLFIAITSFLTLLFAYRRVFPMVLLKLSLLFILYILDVSIYFV